MKKKLENFKIIIVGKINAISTSKIRKMIVIRKNWIENGIREEFKGSNPHSKGEFFSWSFCIFFDKKEAKIIIIIEMIIIKKDIKNKLIINYTKIFRPNDWKSFIRFILYKFIYLINKLLHIKIIKQYLQNVNIMQQLQIRSDGWKKNNYLYVELNR